MRTSMNCCNMPTCRRIISVINKENQFMYFSRKLPCLEAPQGSFSAASSSLRPRAFCLVLASSSKKLPLPRLGLELSASSSPRRRRNCLFLASASSFLPRASPRPRRNCPFLASASTTAPRICLEVKILTLKISLIGLLEIHCLLT